MQFSIIVIAICFFFFLYILYVISKDDFLIIRKDIPMESIFNAAFLIAFISLLFSRFFYVIFNYNPVFKSPLGFLVFPYFPGLYLAGGIIGGVISLTLYLNYKKLPVKRIFDFFSISLLAVLPLAVLGNGLLSNANFIFSLVLFFTYLIIAIIFLKIVFPFAQRNRLKEGSLGALSLIAISILGFLTNLIQFWGKFGIFEKDSLLWALIFISSVIAIVRQELVEKSASKK